MDWGNISTLASECPLVDLEKTPSTVLGPLACCVRWAAPSRLPERRLPAETPSTALAGILHALTLQAVET